MIQGQDHMNAKRYAEAITAYDSALKLMPGDAVATISANQARAEQKRLDDFNNLMIQGQDHMKAKRYAEAITAYDSALKLMPGDAAATNARAAAHQARSTRPAEVSKPLPADVKSITNSIGMKLVRIPAGKFMMGSPDSEADRNTNEEQHEVEITKPFYLGIYTVTQAEYQQVMGTNPSWFSATGNGKAQMQGMDTGRFPVETVSWDDAVAFCGKLSDGPGEKQAGRVYRLPTEAEWEYACRAGTTTLFYFGNSLSSEQANFNGDFPYGGAAKGKYLGMTTVVGSYQPNAYGLYDMHGNVWQWCQDWYTEKPPGGKDPVVTTAASGRVVRGGGWGGLGRNCRSADRGRFVPGSRFNDLGFRVAAVQSGR